MKCIWYATIFMKIEKRYYSYMHKSCLEWYVRNKSIGKGYRKGWESLPCTQKQNKTKQYERLCTTVIATKSTLIFYDIGSMWAGAHWWSGW